MNTNFKNLIFATKRIYYDMYRIDETKFGLEGKDLIK